MSSDPRFSRALSDPRFKRPSKSSQVFHADERFQRMFSDKEFKVKAKMDKFGRKIKPGEENEDIKRFYEITVGKEKKKENEQDEDEEDEDQEENQEEEEDEYEPVVAHRSSKSSAAKSKSSSLSSRVSQRVAPTASGVEEDSSDPDGEGDVEQGEIASYYSNRKMAPPSSDEESDEDDDDDESDLADGGAGEFGPGSGSDSDSTDIGDLSDDYDFGEELPQEEILMGEQPTRRLAVQNLEWDQLKAVDLLVLFRSFAPPNATVLSVTVYPSEFGKQRMEEEKKFGPLGLYTNDQFSAQDYERKIQDKFKELDEKLMENTSTNKAKKGQTKETEKEKGKGSKKENEKTKEKSKKRKAASESDESEADADAEADASDLSDSDIDLFGHTDEKAGAIDQEKLRLYELERLKYFYAIVVCDSAETAAYLYRECDGLEFESSANKLDLRFVPDDVEFDDECRDEAAKVPQSYEAPTFYTKALQQTNVELTWDRDDPKRSKLMKGKFDEEDDLAVYLGNSDSDEGSGSDGLIEASEEDEDGNKTILKKKARKKYAALLAEVDQTKSQIKGEIIEEEGREIVFQPALKAAAEEIVKKVKEAEERKDETVWDKYMRKRKEKKQAKKAAKKAGQEAQNESDNEASESDHADMADDPFFKEAFEDPEYQAMQKSAKQFHDGEKEARARMEKRKKLKERNQMQDDENEDSKRQKAELELLMADGGGSESDEGFDLKKLVKEHAKEKKSKDKGSKTKGKQANDADAAAKDNFSVDTADPRFSALFSDSSYALDPTNPNFKLTKGTEKIIEKRGEIRSKQRQEEAKKAKSDRDQSKDEAGSAPGSSSLAALVSSVKAKSQQREKEINTKETARIEKINQKFSQTNKKQKTQ